MRYFFVAVHLTKHTYSPPLRGHTIYWGRGKLFAQMVGQCSTNLYISALINLLISLTFALKLPMLLCSLEPS